MRRSDGEAIEHRFVTSERLEHVLKASLFSCLLYFRCADP